MRPVLTTARLEVMTRANGACEARTVACGGRGVHAHHRRLRSQGGSDDAGNLLWVCATCHTWIHGHPAASYERGWMLRADAT